ncbi:MAG: UvrD/REP helicase [Marmoricola sp.]|nr:UvrD/REP helicase [Marmoricola sp.]
MTGQVTGVTTYELVRTRAEPVAAPRLDPSQQAVIEHRGGPLLVLAGPGTGKTTTLVEAIVDRIENRGASPESVLALTFSRKAAEQLRDRVTARLGRTMSTNLSSTFHSFAYGLVRRYSPPELYAEPLRLLSAAEQDVVLQQLLTDAPESVRWPDGLRAAVGTRGFAREVQAVLARARERGLNGEALCQLGDQTDRPEFVAAGWFLEQYLNVLDQDSAIDYADLISRAAIEAETHRDELRAQYQHVFVDEYQDTDPSQVGLLRTLAGDGRNLVVVGDPDQSIYGFRGAEVRGILDFPSEFPQPDGSKAPVVALQTTRRFGPRILTAVSRIASSIGVAGAIDADTFHAFRRPEASSSAYGDGRVEVHTYDTARSETEHIADLLRRAHLEGDVGWSEMAVLVRSGRSSLPGLRRSLAGAGVPVEVASDDTPLVREPSVQPLLDAMRAVVNLDNDDPGHVDHLDPARAEALLLSPLAGLDAIEVRSLSRALRSREKARATEAAEPPRSSPALLREAVLHPEVLQGIDLSAAARVRALGTLLRDGRALLDAGATAEEVLWRLWAGTSWSAHLTRLVESGGGAARMAHRDLDAICALFEAAAKAEEQRGHTSVHNFLATLVAQEIPADTLAERGVRGDAVRLLTAHRSKGLEWRLVVVAHVQEEGWPDVRRRMSLLQADRLAHDELLPPVTVSAMLAEERRLFYVACTRARQRLIVTAVASPEDEGEQQSRFLAELGVTIEHQSGRPQRPLSLAGLVAEMRRTVTDPDQPEGLRAEAAARLAVLSQETVRGRALVPQADPASWWGTRAATRSEQPFREADAPLTMSASDLEALLTCPTQWFLEREAGGATRSNSSQGFGLIVHALADRISRGDLPADPEDIPAVMAYVDQVWDQITFRTPWARGREYAQISLALTRFVKWHLASRGRTEIGTEAKFSTEVELPDGQMVILRGYADRIELDDEGRLVVVDLKTGKYLPSGASLKEHVQLGLYQYAAQHGGFDDLVGRPVEPGGAELVQLRASTNEDAKVQRQEPQSPDDEGHLPIERQLMTAANAIRKERLVAIAGDHCRNCNFQAICPIKGAGTVFDQ